MTCETCQGRAYVLVWRRIPRKRARKPPWTIAALVPRRCPYCAAPTTGPANDKRPPHRRPPEEPLL